MDEILGQALQALVALEQTLQEESVVLSAQVRNANAIDAVAQRKQRLVEEINGLMQDSDRQLVSQGYATGHLGLENWLKDLPVGHPVPGVWQSILDITIRCKDLNETNGVQIGLLNRRTQDALSVLFGGSVGNITYGPDGTGRHTSRIHASYKA